MELPTLDGALLCLIALLLPIRLLSLGSRLLLRREGSGRPDTARSALLLAFVAVLLTAIFALSHPSPSDRRDLVSQLNDLRLKTSRLEVILKESTNDLKSKTLYVDESDKMIKEMDEKIQLLQNALHDIKVSVGDFSNTEDRVHALEKEIKFLVEQSRKNKDDIQFLQSSADETTKKIEVATSEVQKMGSIVTEQWIQIRQLEQAFQTTKMMTAKVLKRGPQKDVLRDSKPTKHTVNKVIQFVKGIGRFHPQQLNLPDSFFLTASRSAFSQAYKQIKVLVSIVQNLHYELQRLIKQGMQMNELTVPLANYLVPNLLASATIAIYVISAWNILSSFFSLLK